MEREMERIEAHLELLREMEELLKEMELIHPDLRDDGVTDETGASK